MILQWLIAIQKKLPKKFYGLNKIDKKMLKYLNYSNGYFVDIGAHDGVTYSNTLFYEKNLNWNGLLIEPTPRQYKKLLLNRSRNNSFEQAACVSFDHKKKYTDIAYSSLMSTVLDSKNLIQNPQAHADQGSRFLADEKVHKITVPAVTMTSLLLKNRSPKKIDFLSLDVEGYELEVLNGIDHVKYRFRYILVETRNFDKVETQLILSEYRFIKKLTHHDYLFRDNTIK
jgi:FkbM family methyltransferase